MPEYIQGKKHLIEKITENYDNLIIFMFTAGWCGPCKSIKQKFDDYWCKARPNVSILYLDVEDELNEELVEDFGVESMPTFVLNKVTDGKLEKLDIMVGADIDKLTSLVEQFIK